MDEYERWSLRHKQEREAWGDANPPVTPREWVGLTEEEVLEEEEFINHRYGKPINHTTAILMDFVKQIEDKLRGKNT
jgi:hypothetical protein